MLCPLSTPLLSCVVHKCFLLKVFKASRHVFHPRHIDFYSRSRILFSGLVSCCCLRLHKLCQLAIVADAVLSRFSCSAFDWCFHGCSMAEHHNMSISFFLKKSLDLSLASATMLSWNRKAQRYGLRKSCMLRSRNTLPERVWSSNRGRLSTFKMQCLKRLRAFRNQFNPSQPEDWYEQ